MKTSFLDFEQPVAELEAKGHQLQSTTRMWGNLQLVFKSKQTGTARAASDPRGLDVGWY